MRKEEEAFKKAYEQYSDELFRHCSLRLPDRERALEITQETFVRVWEYIVKGKGEEIRSFRPFLYRTLHNLIIDEYRKAKTQSLEALVDAEEGESIEALLPTDNTNTMETAINRFDGNMVLEKLQGLPDLYREVLVMRYVESLSLKEIAEALDERENAISVRIHRGLKKLRSLMEEHGGMELKS